MKQQKTTCNHEGAGSSIEEEIKYKFRLLHIRGYMGETIRVIVEQLLLYPYLLTMKQTTENKCLLLE